MFKAILLAVLLCASSAHAYSYFQTICDARGCRTCIFTTDSQGNVIYVTCN